MKLDRTISISGSRILHNGEEIRMHIDDEWAVGSSFNEFQKIPLEDIIFVKFTTGENFFLLGLTPYLRNKPALIVYTNKYPSKNKDYKYNNNFILQVTAPLESGENVATQEIVKIHKLDFFPYNEDKTQFNSSTNYLQNIPLYDSFYKNNGFSVR